MPRVSRALRSLVYARDLHRCVHCGQADNLTFQHRTAVGSGGAGRKASALTAADGLAMCLASNVAAEAEGQERALQMGWKLRRNRGGIPASEIPYFDFSTRTYYLPDVDGGRSAVLWSTALELLDAAGNLTRKMVS